MEFFTPSCRSIFPTGTISPWPENMNISGSVGLLVVNSLAFVYLEMSFFYLHFVGYFPWKKKSMLAAFLLQHFKYIILSTSLSFALHCFSWEVGDYSYIAPFQVNMHVFFWLLLFCFQQFDYHRYVELFGVFVFFLMFILLMFY